MVAVGPQSFTGAISMATRQDKKETPLQEQLTEMADLIGKFTALVLMLALLLVVGSYGKSVLS